jgi:hypothetical protein
VIRPEQVLAGALPVTQSAPGQTKEPILTMYGGEIRVEGKKASAEMLNMKPLNSGQRFLLFLQPYGTDVGRYKAAYGAIFEIQDDRMRSLLSMSGGDPFPDLTSRSLGRPADVPSERDPEKESVENPPRFRLSHAPDDKPAGKSPYTNGVTRVCGPS